MDKNYAVVQDGVVVNIVVWDGTQYTPAVDATYKEVTPAIPATYDEDGKQLTPAVDATYEEVTPAVPASGWLIPDGFAAIEIKDGVTVATGFKYDGTTFIGPVAETPAMTADQILAFNTGRRDNFLAVATAAIAPLQDAVDLGEATDTETALLKAWKVYRVAVNRVDLTLASPTWPTAPA
ncbi:MULTISPECIES: tail fiber assembly protein [unclassified Caballeronia]|uniref:tail fiber assembly protein n=1 Tax=unclassified Caballeronia TaxID=2646786 RepID=UPI002027CB25|nr:MULTISPECIES: tail fiber assembly protein [unclassified Caballeronia]